MSSVFADHDGVRIHALDNERVGFARPARRRPGMGESADEFAWMLDALGDRRVLIVDVRGRGGSDAPEHGLHVGAPLRRRARGDRARGHRASRDARQLTGHGVRVGRGVALVDAGTRRRHQRLPGPPRRVGRRRSRVAARRRAPAVAPLAERMDPRVVEQVVRDSEEIPLWDRLAELDCPMLVIGGGRASSIVTDEIVEQYRAARPDVEIACIADQGHDLWSRDIPDVPRRPPPISRANRRRVT